jgi:hypothetical protein
MYEQDSSDGLDLCCVGVQRHYGLCRCGYTNVSRTQVTDASEVEAICAAYHGLGNIVSHQYVPFGHVL